MILRVLIAVTIFFSSPTLFADESVEAMNAITKANAAFDKGEFETALQNYRQAFLITDDARLLYRIGVTFENLANYQRAREHLELYLLKKPTSPYVGRIKKKIENLRKLEQTLQAAIRLTSNPSGAEVYADGEFGKAVGVTPVRIPVGPGTHQFQLRQRGFEVANVSVDVGSSETVDHEVELVETDEIVEVPERDPVITQPEIDVDKPVAEDPKKSLYDGELTYVDVTPPTAVNVLLWFAFPIGVGLGVVGLIFTAIDRPGGIPLMLVGGALSGTSAYFLWFHNWTSVLPNVQTDSPPTAGFGIRF